MQNKMSHVYHDMLHAQKVVSPKPNIFCVLCKK
jgi:hypothetical protein